MPVPATELARLFPLDSLRQETRDQLARDGVVSEYQRGENVFEAGDLDEDTVYLLDGELRWDDASVAPPRTWDREPEASAWRRWTARAVGWLPIESQL